MLSFNFKFICFFIVSSFSSSIALSRLATWVRYHSAVCCATIRGTWYIGLTRGNNHSVLRFPDNPQSIFDLAAAASISPCVWIGQGYNPSMPFGMRVWPHSQDVWNHTAVQTDHKQLTSGAWDFPLRQMFTSELWTPRPFLSGLTTEALKAHALVFLFQRSTSVKQ